MVYFRTGSGASKVFGRRSRLRQIWGWGGRWFAYLGAVESGERRRITRVIADVDS